MLMQLKAPLVEGNMVPITLIVEGPDKQVEEVPLEVPLAHSPPEAARWGRAE